MSFYNLGGEVLTDSSGITYIVSDTFSVLYPASSGEPEVYDWSDLSSVKLNERSIIINTGTASYQIKYDMFESRHQYLSVKTIILTNAKKAGLACVCGTEFLPGKDLYTSYDIPPNAIFSQGEYNIKDIKSSMLLLLIGKTARLLWVVGILGGLASVAILHMIFGLNENNWWYLLIGGFFCGVGAVALLYIILMTISKIKYSSILRSYAKHRDVVTFAVCDEGFSACETDIYSPNDLVHWNPTDRYLETNTMFIITRKAIPILWIPKSLFTREEQNRIGDILVLNLSEK